MNFITLLGVLFVTIPFSSGRLREFEENCNIYKSSQDCRSDLGLVCQDSVCSCKELAFYDTERKACVGLIGESCSSADPDWLTDNFLISRCPLNAVCEDKDPNRTPDVPNMLEDYLRVFSGTLRCLCQRGFYAVDNLRNCVPALGHNQTCSSEQTNKNNATICDVHAGLVCGNGGRCICNGTANTYYDPQSKRCLARFGDACNSNTFCEQNAICSTVVDMYASRGNRNVYGDGVMGKRRIRKKKNENKKPGNCTCGQGYALTGDRKCAGSFKTPCSVGNPCNTDKFLACVDGICQCEAGFHQTFSTEDNSTCVFLPGAVCRQDSGPRCGQNLICSDQGRCECKSGLSETPSGKCLLSYQHDCNMTNTDLRIYKYPQTLGDMAVKERCNDDQGLACLGKKCDCFDSSLKWDSKTQMCTAGENERCGPTVSKFSDAEDFPLDYFVACAEGLSCTKTHKGIDDWRVCEKTP